MALWESAGAILASRPEKPRALAICPILLTLPSSLCGVVMAIAAATTTTLMPVTSAADRRAYTTKDSCG
jgi:hypothetical protein